MTRNAPRTGSSLPLRALLACLALCAAGAPLAAKELSDAEAAKLLDDGRRVLDRGVPDVAIEKYFDPVIDKYEAIRRAPGKRVYVSRTQAELLLYMMTAAQAGENAVGTYEANWVTALELKAYALVEMQRPDEAEKVLHRALELEPMYPVALAELGNIYQQRKQWDKSLDLFTQVEQGAQVVYAEGDENRNFYLARGLRGQGYALTELGRLDESEAVYKRCIALDPHDSKALNELEYLRVVRENNGAPPKGPSPAPAPAESEPGTDLAN